MTDKPSSSRNLGPASDVFYGRAGITSAVQELLSNLVFEACRSCGDLAFLCGFNSIIEFDASNDFSEVVKAP